jgi:carbon monoxide dehydrogenase subunit G
MVRITEQVTVAKPPRAVWDAVVDWRRQGEWVAFTTVSAEPGGHQVGERLTAVTKVGPVGFADVMEVTRWDPPRRVDVKHLGNVVRGTATFRVEPAPGGSRFFWVEDIDIPLGVLGLAGFSLVEPLVRLMLRRSMRRLVRQLEAVR